MTKKTTVDLMVKAVQQEAVKLVLFCDKEIIELL